MKYKNFSFFILGFLVFLNIIVWLVVFDLKPQFLEVNFFDVGQGDAIFIETPQKHQILIDGGPSLVILEKLAKEMPFYDHSIDLIILTHPEKDHLVGLLEVLKRYQVDFIFWTGVIKNTLEWKEWQKLIAQQKEKGTKIFIAQANQRIKFQGKNSCSFQDSSSCIFMEILYPWENLKGKIFKNTSNDSSIVVKLTFGQNSFLFTGDISQLKEKELIERKVNIDSDVLKVAHHGSKTSSAKEFIEKVSPEIAVIQVGKDNRYNHPHQETLETLQKYDIKVLKTNINGDIKIISNGKTLKVKKPNISAPNQVGNGMDEKLK